MFKRQKYVNFCHVKTETEKNLPSDDGYPAVSLGMLLLPAFNSLACNAFLDPLRSANYLQGSALYRWDFLSLAGGSVTASNGMSVSDTLIWQEQLNYDYLVINASWAPENYQQKTIQRLLRHKARQGVRFIALDTGAFVLGYAGLMDGYDATVHNEHQGAFTELFPNVQLRSELFVIDRDRLSCVGGFAAADLSLELLQQHHGIDVASASARYVFKDRLRPGSESSTTPPYEPVGHRLPNVLREAILLMQRNLEEPLRIVDVAHYSGYSPRQLTRLFKQFTGLTPVRYYLNLRLERARGLLTQTEKTIAEIASASGFNASEQFSKCYKQHFSIPPSKDRVSGRIPFHYRSNAEPVAGSTQ